MKNLLITKILSVEQWGDIVWGSMEAAFAGASNMVINATDNPNLTNVTNMKSMFFEAISFNQNISSWDVSGVEDMYQMFYKATSFNNGGQPLTWDVSHVTNMGSLFLNATSFNQNISSWDVSGVEDMTQMFTEATSFNQDISNWDVSSVKYMNLMFQNATSFDQNIGDWDVSSVTDMTQMFNGVTLSTTNYDSILKSWSTLTLQENVEFDAGESIYATARIERQDIIDTYGWTITDGGSIHPEIVSVSHNEGVLTLTFDQLLDNSSVPDTSSFDISTKDIVYSDDFENEEPTIVFGEGTANDWGEDNFSYHVEDGVLTFDNFTDDWSFFSIDPGIDIQEGEYIEARIRYNTTDTDINTEEKYFVLSADDWVQDYTTSAKFNQWVSIATSQLSDSYSLISINVEGLSSSDSLDIDWVKITSNLNIGVVGISNINTPSNYELSINLEETLSGDVSNYISYTKPETNYLLGQEMDIVPDFEDFQIEMYEEEETIVTPTVTTNQATEITQTSVKFNGTISNTGGEEENVTSVGFKYGETVEYGTDINIEGTYGAESFSSNTVTGLTCGTTYHYEAFATNSEDTGYGEDQTFDTLACDEQKHHSSRSSGSTAAYIATFKAQQEMIINPVVTTTPVTDPAMPPAITKTLKYKMTDTEVKTLQEYLNAHGFVVSQIGAGAQGHETTYFGLKTKASVILFQKANGLIADGIVGPITRSKIK